jgi:gamma-glutamylcyclotransferase (GGCT)/AIG2-like uncharacterized protein YtfP
MSRQSDLLFVYGTLMRGGALHRYLVEAGARAAGRGTIRGQLYRIPGASYPGAIASDDERDRVHGELYRLPRPAENLRLLDQVEGCRTGLFRRDLVEVLSPGTKRLAWTYFYSRPLGSALRLMSGRYRPLR